MMRRVIFFLPLLLFCALCLALFWGTGRNNQYVPQQNLGQPAPHSGIAALDQGQAISSSTSAATPIIVNFFASWCLPCRAEHSFLQELARDKSALLYGIAYKDKEEALQKWFDDLGNPYQDWVMDPEGEIAIEWGVSGVPESFLLWDGKIQARHAGPMEESIWQEWQELIKAYQS